MASPQETAVGNAGTSNNDAAGEQSQKDQDFARAREAGWTDRTAIDYDTVQGGGDSNADWNGAARVYEWSGEYGDVGPEVPELEEVLFGGDFVMRQGEHLANLDLEVTVEGPTQIAPIREVSIGNDHIATSLTWSQFKGADLHPVVLRNIDLARYAHPTPIQCYVIPAVTMGLDVVGIAQTGSCNYLTFSSRNLTDM